MSRLLIKTTLVGTFIFALDLASAEDVDYQRDVKPLLQARCYSCHGALKQESELRLDTGALIRKGGASGAAAIAGDPKNSPMVQRIRESDEALRMPPDGEPLGSRDIQRIERWVAQGAISPENEQPEEDPREHWAFQRIVRPPIPHVDTSQAVRNPIDAYIAARHASQAIQPLGAADRQVLLRRVYLDLIGVPPTREELIAHLADPSPSAYESVVDRLLADPRHGERWARHWMDVWRYSDWYGRRHVPDVWNSAPQIWRWRDWIVNSLNHDHGYDRMIQEMLAADEMAPEDVAAGHATGYLIRNWYALNPNDWMRNTVEHTGKAFLGLTFNCAHCHDHKYDPIAQDDYFRLRAFFEPIYIRQDRVAGEADPGPFEDYVYGKLRKIQRVGAVRIFDRDPDAPTWFYSGGDERNREEARGSIRPGVPSFLSAFLPDTEAIELPPRAWYPGLQPAIQQTVLAEAQSALAAAQDQRSASASTTTQPTQAALERLRKAEAAYNEAKSDANVFKALVGSQSLFFDASQGRQAISNRLPGLRSLPDGFTIEFQVAILQDAHFNFQLAKDVDKGLTAAYVAFEQGRVVSYQPGSFTEFETGRYDHSAHQERFLVTLELQTQADRCQLSVRCLNDGKAIVEKAPIALNGWNPIGDPTKAITFDARTGSLAAVDELILKSPTGDDRVELIPAAHFQFESPEYPLDRDVVGLGHWERSPYSVAPATSLVSSSAPDPQRNDLKRDVAAARRAVLAPSFPRKIAEAKVAAADAELESVQARIAADRAKYGEMPDIDPRIAPREWARAASRSERTAAIRQAELQVLQQEHALTIVEATPADDAKREEELRSATASLASAQAQLATEQSKLEANHADENYSPFTPVYPRTSTGRRRALALWITSRDNPLTARVAVNHIWLRHFHAPLVASVDNFGRNGARPSHPELLDWLASELIDSGWSMKHLHRVIVTSEAYMRSSASKASAPQSKVDPENQLLWRMNTGRMEAEVVRDSLLYCADRMNARMGGQELENSESLKTHRRSIYYSVYPEEGGKSPLGELFDGPNALGCYRRTRTVVPQQALALTNSELVHRASAAIVADWRVRAQSTTAEAFVIAMFERILTRRPSPAELKLCVQAFREHPAAAKQQDQQPVPAEGKEPATSDTSDRMTRIRESLVRVLLNHNDFVTIR